MRKEIIASSEAFEAIKQEWKALVARLPDHTIFMTWEWQYLWWETYAERFKNARLRILTYYDEGQLVAILPYFVYDEPMGPFTLRKAAYLASKIESSDYLDIITLPQYREYFEAHLVDDLKSLAHDADVIELNHCLPESIMYQIFQGHSNGNHYVEKFRVCPYVELPESFDAYLKQLSANFRSNVRRRTKKLLIKEKARFELVNETEDIDSVITSVFHLHEKRARQKGLDTKFVPELRQKFHQQVAQALVPQGYIKLFQLTSRNGEKIASLYCFDYGKTLAYFQSGFDPAWSNYSPGLVILGKAIEFAIQQGYRIFDFMRGGEAYKKNWGTIDRYIYLITVLNSPKGWLYLTLLKNKKRLKTIITREKHR